MALSASEAWSRGFVRNTTSDLLVTTTVTTGATWWAGFLRDPDGRLVTA